MAQDDGILSEAGFNSCWGIKSIRPKLFPCATRARPGFFKTEGGERAGLLGEAAGTPSPPLKRSAERCELPQQCSGRRSDHPKVFRYFLAIFAIFKDSLSWHNNTVIVDYYVAIGVGGGARLPWHPFAYASGVLVKVLSIVVGTTEPLNKGQRRWIQTPLIAAQSAL